jgi:hypothetical protein
LTFQRKKNKNKLNQIEEENTMPRTNSQEELSRDVRRDMLSRKLVSLYMRRKELDAEEKAVKDLMIQENILPPQDSMTLTVNDNTFRISHIVSSTLEFGNIEKVFEALPSRKAFFDVVNVSVTKLRLKLGEERINQLSTGASMKEYILVAPVVAPRNGTVLLTPVNGSKEARC